MREDRWNFEADAEERRTSLWRGWCNAEAGLWDGPCRDLESCLTCMERDREENLCSSLMEVRSWAGVSGTLGL